MSRGQHLLKMKGSLWGPSLSQGLSNPSTWLFSLGLFCWSNSGIPEESVILLDKNVHVPRDHPAEEGCSSNSCSVPCHIASQELLGESPCVPHARCEAERGWAGQHPEAGGLSQSPPPRAAAVSLAGSPSFYQKPGVQRSRQQPRGQRRCGSCRVEVSVEWLIDKTARAAGQLGTRSRSGRAASGEGGKCACGDSFWSGSQEMETEKKINHLIPVLPAHPRLCTGAAVTVPRNLITPAWLKLLPLSLEDLPTTPCS